METASEQARDIPAPSSVTNGKGSPTAVPAAPTWPGFAAEAKIPPFHKAGHDYWAPNYEAAMLSALINYPDKIATFTENLSTEHFYDVHNRALFEAIVQLHNKGVAVTQATLIKHLKDLDGYEVEDWITYVATMSQVLIDPDHVKHYKRALIRAVRLRGGDSYCVHEYNEAFCAELLQLQLPKVCCIGAEWREYAAGIWEQKARDLFRPRARAVIHPYQVQSRRIFDVLTNVESALQVNSADFCGAYKILDERIHINVDNGVVEVARDGKITFRDHSPADRFTLKLATNYIPSAQCELYEKVLVEALPDAQDRKLLQCFAGYILYPACDHEVCLVCFGPSETGKSTAALAIRETLGTNLCGSVDLDALCNNGYSLPGLKFKLLNLGSELKGSEIAESANFKKIVSGEFLNTRAIYGTPEEMRTTVKLLFLSNHMPRFNSGTDAELRRMRMLHFNRRPMVKDLQLKAKLRYEASGILNWMISGLCTLLRENEMPHGGVEAEKLVNAFSASNDPVGRFVTECCELDPFGEVNKDVLLAGFKEWCEVKGVVLASDKMEAFFYKKLRDHLPHLTYVRRRTRGKTNPERARFVVGIRVAKNHPTLMPKSVGEEFDHMKGVLGSSAWTVEVH